MSRCIVNNSIARNRTGGRSFFVGMVDDSGRFVVPSAVAEKPYHSPQWLSLQAIVDEAIETDSVVVKTIIVISHIYVDCIEVRNWPP